MRSCFGSGGSERGRLVRRAGAVRSAGTLAEQGQQGHGREVGWLGVAA